MIPKTMKIFLEDALPESVREKWLIQDRSFCFLEFGPLDVDRLQRLGIRVDRLGPRLVSCFWDRESPLEIDGYLVVDNLAMGAPSMGGTRMLPNITPDIIHDLVRGARIVLVKAQKLMTGKKTVRAGKILTEFIRKHPDENHAFVTYPGRL